MNNNKYIVTLERIARLGDATEMRGGLTDIGVPEHLVQEGGWVPIDPRVKQGLAIAARIARLALEEGAISDPL